MKEIIMTVLLVAFGVGLAIFFLFNDTTGLRKDVGDLKTQTSSKMQSAKTTLDSITP
jgi:uncharacterized protein YxeA